MRSTRDQQWSSVDIVPATFLPCRHHEQEIVVHRVKTAVVYVNVESLRAGLVDGNDAYGALRFHFGLSDGDDCKGRCGDGIDRNRVVAGSIADN